MKLYFQILALCFLTGCFEEESPLPKSDEPEETKEQAQNDKKPIDPFGLDALFQQPLEALPSAMPKHGKDIISDNSIDNSVSSESLEGSWYGGLFSSLASQEVMNTRRVYLQFKNDKTFTYGCVIKGLSEQAILITGKYWLKDNILHVKTDPQKEGDDYNSYMCEGVFWRTGTDLEIPARHDISNTLTLFDRNFSTAKVFLVKK